MYLCAENFHINQANYRKSVDRFKWEFASSNQHSSLLLEPKLYTIIYYCTSDSVRCNKSVLWHFNVNYCLSFLISLVFCCPGQNSAMVQQACSNSQVQESLRAQIESSLKVESLPFQFKAHSLKVFTSFYLAITAGPLNRCFILIWLSLFIACFHLLIKPQCEFMVWTDNHHNTQKHCI